MNIISENILTGLISLLQKIEFEILLLDETTTELESTLIDKLIENGYSLHFYRLTNFQVLSTICSATQSVDIFQLKVLYLQVFKLDLIL